MEVGLGGYRTVPGAMTLCIAVATNVLWFLRTICAHMSRLVTTTTSDRGQKLLGKRFFAFFGVVTFLTNTHVKTHRTTKSVRTRNCDNLCSLWDNRETYVPVH